MCDSRPKTRIRYKKVFYALAISSQDYHQILALIFHDLQKDLDGFLSVILLVFRTVQIVGLVDEEYAAHGALEHLFGRSEERRVGKECRCGCVGWGWDE